MAKRFRLRLSRVIPSFQSCRSKDPSTLPSNPVPSFLRPPPLRNHDHFTSPTPTLPLPLPSTKTHHYSSIKRHVSFCGFRSRPTLSDDDRTGLPPDHHHHQFEWEREDKWHVVAKVYDLNPRRKIYTSSASPGSDIVHDGVSPPPSADKENKKKNPKRRGVNKKKKKSTSRIRISTSSFETGLFSSDCGGFDDGEETETLVSTRSSRSFSTDSSPIKRKKKRSSKARRSSVSSRRSSSVETETAPARLSMFQRLIGCRVEGKVRESFAVVKKSEDPYEDFKRSMMEMILEKQMFDKTELEQLLHCFLSLNSKEHHPIIVQVFTDIWEAFFCSS